MEVKIGYKYPKLAFAYHFYTMTSYVRLFSYTVYPSFNFIFVN